MENDISSHGYGESAVKNVTVTTTNPDAWSFKPVNGVMGGGYRIIGKPPLRALLRYWWRSGRKF